MRTFSEYIREAVDFRLGGKTRKGLQYNYTPKDKDELYELICKLREERGDEGDFNDIDTNAVTDMSGLFFKTKSFNGIISGWDTSNVTDMHDMFWHADSFNRDISRWDTSNVKNMNSMFYNAKSFDQDISNWNTSYMTKHFEMFSGCPIKEEYKPKFKI